MSAAAAVMIYRGDGTLDYVILFCRSKIDTGQCYETFAVSTSQRV